MILLFIYEFNTWEQYLTYLWGSRHSCVSSPSSSSSCSSLPIVRPRTHSLHLLFIFVVMSKIPKASKKIIQIDIKTKKLTRSCWLCCIIKVVVVVDSDLEYPAKCERLLEAVAALICLVRCSEMVVDSVLL